MKTTILAVFCGAVLGFSLSVQAQTNTTLPTICVNGVTYFLGTNSISATMVHGQGDKGFEVIIHGTGFYSFSVYGYGVGFPTYGIIADTASGGATGDFALKLHFNDKYLTPDGDKSKTYSGYLPIHIFQGSENGFDTNYFRLPVTVTVFPAISGK